MTGTVLYGYLDSARNMEASQKTPLIVHIYGGPAGQTVQTALWWNTALFHQLLAERRIRDLLVDK